jgi:hypothetical protein
MMQTQTFVLLQRAWNNVQVAFYEVCRTLQSLGEFTIL